MSFPAKPNYTVAELEEASRILIQDNPTEENLKHATTILDKWRAAHAYPINTFQATLRDKVRPFGNAIVAQRLKRAPTIVGKLSRLEHRLNLATMQDIGGVRAVLKTVDDVKKLRGQYIERGRFTHILEREDDYIARPKADGYSGIHLIYRYRINRPPSERWNDLLIEMQLRTELQHYWATAVEVTGTILREPFKFGGSGEAEWREFFKLVSCAFSHIENRPVIRGYRDLSKKQVFQKVAEAEKSLNALQKMRLYSVGLNFIRERGSRKNKYHVISLNLEKKSLTISSFTELGVAKASAAYSKLEKNQTDEGVDTVLVSTAKSDDLQRAYPNYFLDISDFSKKVQEIINVP